jgi:hypothetical protein
MIRKNSKPDFIDNCSGSESYERDKEELQQRKNACLTLY